jgi:thymidylate kinase
MFLVLAVLNRRFLELPILARRPAPGGGVLIAFVGVDGSGKSTQVRQASAWLASEIDVITKYFGSGDGRASFWFRPLKRVAEAIGSRLREKPRGASHGRVSDRPAGPLYSVLFAIWALAVAWDKRVKLISAQRAVSRGFVVVTDRYPQNEIPGYNDGPLLHRLAFAPRWLIDWERSVYQLAQRTPPDLVLKLHVGAATVARREPDMRPDLIQQRIEWLKRLSCGGAKCVSIDASAPLAEVTRIVRRAIWDIL